MFYRETGQFKTSYRADQAIFPIRQDRIFILIWLLIGFAVIPFIASEYAFRAILIPVTIMALAALGLNILVGYCGQVSLGTGAFMAVGAYAAYNFMIRVPGLNPLFVFYWADFLRQVSASCLEYRAFGLKVFIWRSQHLRFSSSQTGPLVVSAGLRTTPHLALSPYNPLRFSGSHLIHHCVNTFCV